MNLFSEKSKKVTFLSLGNHDIISLIYGKKAESFYNIKYGLSIIMSKLSKNLTNENINTGVSVVFKTKRESK